MFKVQEIKTGWIYMVYGINQYEKEIYDTYDGAYPYRKEQKIEFLIFYNNIWQWIDAEEVVPYTEKK